MAEFLTSMVTDDPETNALWVVRFTSVQFVSALTHSSFLQQAYSDLNVCQGMCFFTSLTRTDANAALALLGLYSSFGVLNLFLTICRQIL